MGFEIRGPNRPSTDYAHIRAVRPHSAAVLAALAIAAPLDGANGMPVIIIRRYVPIKRQTGLRDFAGKFGEYYWTNKDRSVYPFVQLCLIRIPDEHEPPRIQYLVYSK